MGPVTDAETTAVGRWLGRRWPDSRLLPSGVGAALLTAYLVAQRSLALSGPLGKQNVVAE